MTNSKGLDSKDEQFMLEQQLANKRTIREERGQSNRLKKLQSCLGQMTATVPDMPCSEQLRACSAYTLSQHITSQSRHGCLDPKELRKVHSIIPCSVVPDVHKIKQYLRLNNLSYLEFLLFQVKSYSCTSFFSKGRETKAWMAKRFNSQVYLN